MSTDLVKAGERASMIRPPTGLLLSIGDTTTNNAGTEYPVRIDHFRPKPGQLDQYSAEAQKFLEVYGDEPKQLDDVIFLSNNVGDVLDIRLMAWGTSGVRLRGDTNFATLPPEEWEARAFAFDDDVVFYPLEPKEVRKELRDEWKGEPIRDRLVGPDDPRIEKLSIGVEATLSFCLPQVMGIGKVAQITTKGRRSMRNLYSSVHDQWHFFQAQVVGVPFRLSVRPARTRRFDKEKRRYVPVEFFELVLDTPLTVAEVIEVVRERQEALSVGARRALPAGANGGDALAAALDLPAAPDEEVQLRDEPSESDRLDDALLNRLAALESEVGQDGARALLRGIFGVDVATELTQQDAERYEHFLLNASTEDAGEVEVVPEPESDEGLMSLLPQSVQEKLA